MSADVKSDQCLFQLVSSTTIIILTIVTTIIIVSFGIWFIIWGMKYQDIPDSGYEWSFKDNSHPISGVAVKVALCHLMTVSVWSTLISPYGAIFLRADSCGCGQLPMKVHVPTPPPPRYLSKSLAFLQDRRKRVCGLCRSGWWVLTDGHSEDETSQWSSPTSPR